MVSLYNSHLVICIDWPLENFGSIQMPDSRLVDRDLEANAVAVLVVDNIDCLDALQAQDLLQSAVLGLKRSFALF